MNIQAIRQAVMALYPNATWHRRVHNMADNQVIAIYKKSQERKNRQKADPIPEKEDWSFCNKENHQIDIWEWLNEKEVNNEETV